MMKLRKKLMLGFIRAKFIILTRIDARLAGGQAFRLFCTPFLAKQLPDKAIFQSAEQLQFSLHGKRVCGYRFNAAQQHKVLLLHGFSSTCQNFEAYIRPLVDKNIEVLAFDAPAHGKSEGKRVNAVDYADMIRKVVELYGPVRGYVAHSFGGIAVSLALEELPHDAFTKLVLIAPATETSSAIDGAFAMLHLNNPVLRKAIDEKIFSIQGKPTSWYSVRRAIKNIKADVLWIHDKDDDITPVSDALRVQEDMLPHVKFIFTEGLGHRRIYKTERIIKAVTDFL